MAKRVDRNQAEIVEALRGIGASVQVLHVVGHGCPDLVVGWKNQNYLLEVKDWQQPPAKRRLTTDEREWHASWRGQACIVESIEDAFVAIGAQARLFTQAAS